MTDQDKKVLLEWNKLQIAEIKGDKTAKAKAEAIEKTHGQLIANHLKDAPDFIKAKYRELINSFS